MAFKLFGKKKKRTVSRSPKVKLTHQMKAVKKAALKKSPKVKAKASTQKHVAKKVEQEFKKMPDDKAYELLRRYRISVPEYAFCKTEDDVKEALKKTGFPCALKVSGEVLHKTNVNGVRLNVANEADALNAFKELIKIKGTNRVLVQKMITEGYELIVGGKKDPQFKTVVALGAGGILTEVIKDVSFRVAPLGREDAEAMLKEVKFSDLILKGFRGQKPADANSIIDVILSVSKIMESNQNIREFDINPLCATPTKAIAVDVRIILE